MKAEKAIDIYKQLTYIKYKSLNKKVMITNTINYYYQNKLFIDCD